MSASKRKGTSFETAVVGYLRDEHGLPVERRALRGTRDCGDITGLPRLGPRAQGLPGDRPGRLLGAEEVAG